MLRVPTAAAVVAMTGVVMFGVGQRITGIAGCIRWAARRTAIGARMAAACLLAGAVAMGSAADAQPLRETTSRLIIKLKEPAAIPDLRPPQRIVRLALDEGIELRHERSMALGAELMG